MDEFDVTVFNQKMVIGRSYVSLPADFFFAIHGMCDRNVCVTESICGNKLGTLGETCRTIKIAAGESAGSSATNIDSA